MPFYKGLYYLVEYDPRYSKTLFWRVGIFQKLNSQHICIYFEYYSAHNSAIEAALQYIDKRLLDAGELNIDEAHRKAISKLIAYFPDLKERELYICYLNVCLAFVSWETFEMYLTQVENRF